jgi:hypothetical protein
MERRFKTIETTHEDVRENHTAAQALVPEARTPKRTVRMRVFNFKPLTRPPAEIEPTLAPKSASLSKASRLVE